MLASVGSLCTGTLIHPQVFLTAGHCVEPELLTGQMENPPAPEDIEYSVTFARDLRAAAPADFLKAREVIWHQSFPNLFGILVRPGQMEDIALVFLEEPVTDRDVQALMSSEEIEQLAAGVTLPVVGYGLTDDQDDMSAGALHDGVSTLDEVGDFEIIAGVSDPQQACRGDSGGPALVVGSNGELLQVGIASRINAPIFPPPQGPPPCQGGLLYTRVDSYIPWIEETIAGYDFGSPGDGDGDGDGDGGTGGSGSDGGDGGGCSTGGSGGLPFGLLFLAGSLFLRRRRKPSVSAV